MLAEIGKFDTFEFSVDRINKARTRQLPGDWKRKNQNTRTKHYQVPAETNAGGKNAAWTGLCRESECNLILVTRSM